MKKMRVAVTFISGVAIAMGGLLASAPTASAAGCPSYDICFYEHTSYAGAQSNYASGVWIRDLAYTGYNQMPLIKMNDSISSIINNIPNNTTPVWSDRLMNGQLLYVSNGKSYANLGDYGMNDKISSIG
ncbi:peptidase inhibitor family I36 protein [Streptomyces sp. NPDC095817]|uniref:peptidase inhibitor family I36 protein n=1 Tax=Streptomyces sp. NPDC095817 TaxID=3155082 RepID=UPI0033248EF4